MPDKTILIIILRGLIAYLNWKRSRIQTTTLEPDNTNPAPATDHPKARWFLALTVAVGAIENAKFQLEKRL